MFESRTSGALCGYFHCLAVWFAMLELPCRTHSLQEVELSMYVGGELPPPPDGALRKLTLY